jgi:hypothetical protein
MQNNRALHAHNADHYCIIGATFKHFNRGDTLLYSMTCVGRTIHIVYRIRQKTRIFQVIDGTLPLLGGDLKVIKTV